MGYNTTVREGVTDRTERGNIQEYQRDFPRMIRMDQQISMRPEMRQFLAPQMQQSLHMLQMNSFELDQFIEENLEANPF